MGKREKRGGIREESPKAGNAPNLYVRETKEKHENTGAVLAQKANKNRK